MTTQRITYRFFGIPVWSVERVINTDDLYQEIANRLATDMKEAFTNAATR